VEDPTREMSNNLFATKMVELLQEMFQNINSWLTLEQVRTYHLQVARDPGRQCSLLSPIIFKYSCLYTRSHALDNIIVPTPGVEGETPIMVVPVSARSPSAEPASASSKGPSAGSSRTWVGKRKVADTPASKKARKVISKKP
jgi:hypothetical protein